MSLSTATELLRSRLDRLESVTMLRARKKAAPKAAPLDENKVILLLGSVLAGLAHVARLPDIRSAMRWWAETDQAWEDLEQIREVRESLTLEMRKP